MFLPPIIIILAASNAGYGWALEKRANIAVPLILQIISESCTDESMERC
jgi:hypothetical protein